VAELRHLNLPKRAADDPAAHSLRSDPISDVVRNLLGP